MSIKELLKEYWKGLFLFMVTPTFGWWSGGFNLLSDYLYEKSYELSRAFVIIFVLCLFLATSIAARNYRALRHSHNALINENNDVDVGVELQKVLAVIYHTPEGNLQSKTTLVEAQVAPDIQTGQYYLEKLESLGLVNWQFQLEETDERQYELTANGRAFVIENQLHQRHNNSRQGTQQSCAHA